MAGEQTPLDADSAARRRALAALLATTFLGFLNFTGLLAVVPLWAAAGGLSSGGVGATTATMMGATVLTQLASRWVYRVLSLRWMVALGSALLGLPTPLYALSTDVVPILVLTAVRGVGFALVVVAGATLLAEVVPAGRFARAVSYYGVASALPNVIALGGGVWAADAWGFPAVFVTTGALGLVGTLLALRLLPAAPRGSFTGANRQDVARVAPTLALFVAATASFGAVSTFLPLSGPGTATTAFALLVASCGIVAGRLGAGALSDRVGAGRLLVPAAAAVALGLLLIAAALTGPAWLLALGGALVGTGFGASQNDSFVATMRDFGRARTGTASTIWNIAFDGGVGAGAFSLGWVIAQLGHAGAYVALAATIAVVVLACLPAVRRRPAGSAAD